MTIDVFHNLIDQRLRKTQGGYLAPEQKDMEINRAQYEVFEKYKKIYAINQQAKDALLPFRTEFIINNGNSANGLITLPADYYHFINIITVVTDSNGTHYYDVENVNDDQLGKRKNSSLKPQTVYNPYGSLIAPASQYGQYRFQVYPAQATAGTLYYLRKPTTVHYAYTLTNGRPVYNQSSSTQLEWNEPLCNEISNEVLENLGLTVQDATVMQMAEKEEGEG